MEPHSRLGEEGRVRGWPGLDPWARSLPVRRRLGGARRLGEGVVLTPQAHLPAAGRKEKWKNVFSSSL